MIQLRVIKTLPYTSAFALRFFFEVVFRVEGFISDLLWWRV